MRSCELYYSRVLSIPVAGDVFYSIQLILIHFKIWRKFFLSKKEKKFLPIFIRILETECDIFVCKTFNIGHVLTFFRNPITLDIRSQKLPDIANENDYQNVLWTLVVAQKVDKYSQKELEQRYGFQAKSIYFQ